MRTPAIPLSNDAACALSWGTAAAEIGSAPAGTTHPPGSAAPVSRAIAASFDAAATSSCGSTFSAIATSSPHLPLPHFCSRDQPAATTGIAAFAD
nr:hypothetical protein [Nocardia abscessus]